MNKLYTICASPFPSRDISLAAREEAREGKLSLCCVVSHPRRQRRTNLLWKRAMKILIPPTPPCLHFPCSPLTSAAWCQAVTWARAPELIFSPKLFCHFSGEKERKTLSGIYIFHFVLCAKSARQIGSCLTRGGGGRVKRSRSGKTMLQGKRCLFLVCRCYALKEMENNENILSID